MQTEDRKRLSLIAGAILVVLTFFVVALRLYGLSKIPPGIINDEGAVSAYALQVLQGRHAPFFPEWSAGVEAFGVYAVAITTLLFGRSLLAFHLPAALASASTVFVVLWMGWLLFGRDETNGRAVPWRGLFVGAVASGLLATSIDQTIMARGAFRANFLPFLLALSLSLLWFAWYRSGRRTRPWSGIALAGICAGLLPYTYLPSRLSPLLFLLFGLSLVIPFNSNARERVLATWPLTVAFVGVTGLVAAPLLIHFALHPEHFFIRSEQLWLFRDGQLGAWRAYFNNALEYLLLFGFKGDRNSAYSIGGRPMLAAWEATFFWLGVVFSIFQWRRRPSLRLLLIWLFVMLLPASLTLNEYEGPNSLRIIGTTPAVFLLVGVGMWETCHFLYKRLSILHNSKSAIFAGVVVAALIVAKGAHTYRTYFFEWVGTDEYLAVADAEMTYAAEILNARSPLPHTAYLLPNSLADKHFGLDYLYTGSTPAVVVFSFSYDLPLKIETQLSGLESVSTIKVFDWTDSLGWAGGGEEHTLALLEKYGKYQESVEYSYFQIHTYTDVDLSRPWTFYQQLEGPEVHYDRGISLLGFALGQGREQFSNQQTPKLSEDRTLWIAQQWQTAPGLDMDFAISMRLHNPGGEAVYQWDIVLKDSMNLETSHWEAATPIDTLYHFDLPGNLQPAEYELRMVVYDFESLQPTVEMDTWELELALARLQLVQNE